MDDRNTDSKEWATRNDKQRSVFVRLSCKEGGEMYRDLNGRIIFLREKKLNRANLFSILSPFYSWKRQKKVSIRNEG